MISSAGLFGSTGTARAFFATIHSESLSQEAHPAPCAVASPGPVEKRCSP